MSSCAAPLWAGYLISSVCSIFDSIVQESAKRITSNLLGGGAVASELATASHFDCLEARRRGIIIDSGLDECVFEYQHFQPPNGVQIL